MEERFDRDFGEVRIHTDDLAVRSARIMNASAYTHGRDVILDPAHFQPNTSDGRRLLAHELTHVVQQNSSPAPTEASSERRPQVTTQYQRSPESVLGVATASPMTIQCSHLPPRSLHGTVDPDMLTGEDVEDELTRIAYWLGTNPEEGDRQFVEDRQHVEEMQEVLWRVRATRGGLVQAARLQARIGLAGNPIGNFVQGFVGAAAWRIRPANWSLLERQIEREPVQFGAGISLGVPVGALAGLWANIEALVQLVAYLSVFGLVGNASLELTTFLRNPTRNVQRRAEQLAGARRLVEAVGFIVGQASSDPTFINQFGEELGELAGRETGRWFNQDFIQRPTFDKGRTIGEVMGRILIEVVLLFFGPEEWIARGGAGAAQAIHVSAELERALMRMLREIPELRQLLRLREGRRALQAAGETRAAETVGAAGVEAARGAERGVEAARGAGVTSGELAPTGPSAASNVSSTPPRLEVLPGELPPWRRPEPRGNLRPISSGRTPVVEPPPPTGAATQAIPSELEQTEVAGQQIAVGAEPTGPRASASRRPPRRRPSQTPPQAPPETATPSAPVTTTGEASGQPVGQGRRRSPGSAERPLTREQRRQVEIIEEFTERSQTRVHPEEARELGLSESSQPRWHWRVTEEELSLLERSFPFQTGWRRNRHVVSESSEAARTAYTQPDSFHPAEAGHPAVSLEAKNYLLDDAAVAQDNHLMEEFLARTVTQARDRATHLPSGVQQHILIDIRGQSVSPASRQSIRQNLQRLSGGILQSDRVHFLFDDLGTGL
jgi:hypothetical protein